MSEPFITTDRLDLWRPAAADIEPMFEIMQDPRTWRYFGAPIGRAEHTTRFMRNAGSWALYGYGSLMVRERGQDPVIGNCGVFHTWRGLGDDFDDKPEAGWILSAEHTGKGYAREAMRAIFARFDEAYGEREVVCLINPANTPSVALAHKLGFAETRRATMPGTEDPVQLFTRRP